MVQEEHFIAKPNRGQHPQNHPKGRAELTATEARLRPAPKVKWRIVIPTAPEGPPTISVNMKRWSIFTHWALTILVTAWIAVRLSYPFNIGNGTIIYNGWGTDGLFFAAIGGVIFYGISYWTIREAIFQNFAHIRRARKVYNQAMSNYTSSVQSICKEAASSIHGLWFPLCRYEKAQAHYNDEKIWWRTGDEANSFSVKEFYKVSYTAGEEKLVRFPECGYAPDPDKPGTAKFFWGSGAVIQDPEFL